MLFRKWIALSVMCVIECALFFSVTPGRADPLTTEEKSPSVRDGQHDFDFDFGTWKTHSSRLLHPLSGSKLKDGPSFSCGTAAVTRAQS